MMIRNYAVEVEGGGRWGGGVGGGGGAVTIGGCMGLVRSREMCTA